MAELPPYSNANPPPENHPGMVLCDGRYFYGMVMLPFRSRSGERGADVTGLLWRYADKPTDWVFTSRIRMYAGANNDPWDGQDKRRWFVNKFANCTDDQARLEVEKSLVAIALTVLAMGSVPLAPDWCVIQGDNDKAHEVMTKRPPFWMHSKTVTVDTRTGKKVGVHTRGWHPPAQ
jgi:hypothetical protein